MKYVRFFKAFLKFSSFSLISSFTAYTFYQNQNYHLKLFCHEKDNEDILKTKFMIKDYKYQALFPKKEEAYLQLKEDSDKIIFFYSSDTSEIIKRIVDTELQKLTTYRKMKIIFINLDDSLEEVIKYLTEEKVSVTIDQIKEEFSFLLCNKFQDHWFWALDFITTLLGESMTQLINFFSGLPIINNSKNFILMQNQPNLISIASYSPSPFDYHKQLKTLRKFNTKNTDEFIPLRFFLITNKKLATKLGISTQEQDIGDLYKIVMNENGNIKIKNHKFKCELWKRATEANDKLAQINTELFNSVLSEPIFIEDISQYIRLKMKISNNLLSIFVDSSKYSLKSIYDILIKLRKKYTFTIEKDKNSICFAIIDKTSLPPLIYNTSDEFTVIFDPPITETINCLKEYLPRIRKIEGLSLEDYIKKCKISKGQFNDQKLASSKADKKSESEAKASLFSSDRFILDKIYKMKGDLNINNIDTFIIQCLEGKYPLYNYSVPLSNKSSIRVTGDDFSKMVLKSPYDCLVFFANPIKERNGHFLQIFEKFAQKFSDSNLRIYRANTTNECDEFVFPIGPTVALFKNKNKSSPIYLDIRKFQNIDPEEINKLKLENKILTLGNDLDLQDKNVDKIVEEVEEGIKILEEFVKSN